MRYGKNLIIIPENKTEAYELLTLAGNATFEGKCDFENQYFLEWNKENKFSEEQKLLIYSTVFVNHCSLGAAVWFSKNNS